MLSVRLDLGTRAATTTSHTEEKAIIRNCIELLGLGVVALGLGLINPALTLIALGAGIVFASQGGSK